MYEIWPSDMPEAIQLVEETGQGGRPDYGRLSCGEPVVLALA